MARSEEKEPWRSCTREEAYSIVGACLEVYNQMGCGFLEPVYQGCLEIELESRRIPLRTQAELSLTDKDRL